MIAVLISFIVCLLSEAAEALHDAASMRREQDAPPENL